MSENELKLKQVLADVFGLQAEEIDENASTDTVEDWDSLRHLNLVIALEEAFDLSFSEDQAVEILDFLLIKETLKEHGVDFNA
jgi:acyl carrier protein